MHAAMKDIRGAIAAVALMGAMLCFVVLVIQNHTEEAKQILMLVGAPALTFVLGLGSQPFVPEQPTDHSEAE